MNVKKTITYKLAFLKSPINLMEPSIILLEIAYLNVIKKVIFQILMTQATIKTSRSYMIYFQIPHMIRG